MAKLREDDNPLTPQQIDALRMREADMIRIDQLIEKACKCGIDQRAEKALCGALRQRIGALLDTFGGGR